MYTSFPYASTFRVAVTFCDLLLDPATSKTILRLSLSYSMFIFWTLISALESQTENCEILSVPSADTVCSSRAGMAISSHGLRRR